LVLPKQNSAPVSRPLKCVRGRNHMVHTSRRIQCQCRRWRAGRLQSQSLSAIRVPTRILCGVKCSCKLARIICMMCDELRIRIHLVPYDIRTSYLGLTILPTPASAIMTVHIECSKTMPPASTHDELWRPKLHPTNAHAFMTALSML